MFVLLNLGFAHHDLQPARPSLQITWLLIISGLPRRAPLCWSVGTSVSFNIGCQNSWIDADGPRCGVCDQRPCRPGANGLDDVLLFHHGKHHPGGTWVSPRGVTTMCWQFSPCLLGGWQCEVFLHSPTGVCYIWKRFCLNVSLVLLFVCQKLSLDDQQIWSCFWPVRWTSKAHGMSAVTELAIIWWSSNLAMHLRKMIDWLSDTFNRASIYLTRLPNHSERCLPRCFSTLQKRVGRWPSRTLPTFWRRI